MKKIFIITVFIFCFCLFAFSSVQAQCSICTRTASQLGEEPAKGLNAGILYLAAIPYLTVGVIAYRWWKRNGPEKE